MCTCSSQKDNEVVMNQNAIFINHVNLLNSAAKTGSSKKYCFRFLGFSCSFTYKLLVGRHGDMRQCREWPRCVIQWCCGALRCWDLCTSSRLDVAAPGTWHRHGYVCVCASGVARISTDGFLHTMRVQRRFVVFISIHIYYIPCIVPGRDGAEDSKNKPWL